MIIIPYSLRTITNRNSRSSPSANERLNRQARRAYARLRRGMEEERCWWITLIKGRGLDLGLREHAWKMLRTRLGKEWPDFAFWTGYEYGQWRGVHLNVVVKGTPGLTEEWVRHVVALLGDGTEVHIQPIRSSEDDRRTVARYLTKQLTDGVIQAGWPKGFRVVTTSRQWCSEWLSREAWAAQQRSRLGLTAASRSEPFRRRREVSSAGSQAS